MRLTAKEIKKREQEWMAYLRARQVFARALFPSLEPGSRGPVSPLGGLAVPTQTTAAEESAMTRTAMVGFAVLWIAFLAGVLVVGLCKNACAQLAPPPATQASVPIVGTAASASVLIAGIAGERIYVTSLSLVPVATSVVTFSQGTGSSCSGGTASNLTGVLTFAAGQTLSLGSGWGAVIVTLSGNNLCITIATAAAPGSISYSQF
jgi:hypothetical protein